jgi:HAMP domain-containing protein
MVDEDLERRAEELRDIAARLRRLAQQTRSPDPRRELVNLAERFERMAQSLAGGGPSEPEA